MFKTTQPERAFRDPDPSWGWNGLCSEPAEICVIPGAHYTILEGENVRLLAKLIRGYLERLPAGQRSRATTQSLQVGRV